MNAARFEPAFIPFGYVPVSGIAGSYGSSVFHFLRNLHPVYHSVSMNLQSHQQRTSVPSFHTFTPTVSSFYDSHFNKCELITHCDFDLHLPGD